MCGIAGTCSFKKTLIADESDLRRFAEPLKYRGPDAEGYFLDNSSPVKVAFAHKRLSIIDLTTDGDQPMKSISGNTMVVFNGEIYNYKTLRQDLEKNGLGFRSNSDTEVLLNGFEAWGIEELLRKIDGMFAFALYSFKEEKLYLARDRFGKKPLYIHESERYGLTYSSDIRSFQSLDIPLSLDTFSLGYFFGELATPGERTIWNEVTKMPAGSWMEFSKDQTCTYRYWSLKFSNESSQQSVEQHVDRIDELITSAVQKRLVADVNVAAQLSGGVDSSLMVAKMSQLSSKKIKTYSVGFTDQTFNELPYARQVAEKYETDHAEFIMSPEDLTSAHDLILEFGEPFADVSMIPSYLIAKEISSSEKVVIGGDGGDELFAGYYSYYFAEKRQKVKKMDFLSGLVKNIATYYPSYRVRLLSELLQASKKPNSALLDRNIGFSSTELMELSAHDPAFSTAVEQEHDRVWEEDGNLLTSILTASVKTRLYNDYLVKTDRSSMYASLEMRSPLLDKDLAEYVSGIPEHYFLRNNGVKSLLKAVAERYLPYDLIHRNKMGFSVPASNWFKKDLETHWKEVVLHGKQQLFPMNYDMIHQLFEDHKSEKVDHGQKLWILFVFHIWAQNIRGK